MFSKRTILPFKSKHVTQPIKQHNKIQTLLTTLTAERVHESDRVSTSCCKRKDVEIRMRVLKVFHKVFRWYIIKANLSWSVYVAFFFFTSFLFFSFFSTSIFILQYNYFPPIYRYFDLIIRLYFSVNPFLLFPSILPFLVLQLYFFFLILWKCYPILSPLFSLLFLSFFSPSFRPFFPALFFPFFIPSFYNP